MNTKSQAQNASQGMPENNDPAIRPLPTPAELKRHLPLSDELVVQVEEHRQQLRDALAGQDSRLVIITGPCSIHDEEAVLDYGQRLAQLNEALSDRLLIVMRAYIEKPRTNVGWKGLAYDPERNGKGDMQQGLERSRRVMIQLAELGLPLATEALSPLTMLYLDDLVSWTAIGARTAESQIHREMVSHLPMPVGIKNGTDGSINTAVNAMISARHSHHTLGMDCHGQIAMLDTPGNPDTHLVLRGGRGITNYDAESIATAMEQLQQAECNTPVLVDCSHDNACKQHRRQMDIAKQVVQQRVEGNKNILGLMLESFLVEGKHIAGQPLEYGVSITDPCLGWEQTQELLHTIYAQLAG